MADRLKPSAAAVICLLLPFVSACTEYWIHTLRCWVQANMFSLQGPARYDLLIGVLLIDLPLVFCLDYSVSKSMPALRVLFPLWQPFWVLYSGTRRCLALCGLTDGGPARSIPIRFLRPAHFLDSAQAFRFVHCAHESACSIFLQ